MNDLRKAIFDKIKANTAIMDMLASNYPYWENSTKKTKEASLVPVHNINANLKPNFLSFDFGDEPRIYNDRLVEFYERIVYIRAYIAKGFGYGEADNLLREVYKTLNNKDLVLQNDVLVQAQHLTTGRDSYDEGLNLNYIESIYSFKLLK